ncbi:Fis family transcriptional regulator, partial [Pseudomonas aeruginosa]
YSPARLLEVARPALQQRGLAREVSAVRRHLAAPQDLGQRIIGRSPAFHAFGVQKPNVGVNKANVDILRVYGTGKVLVGRCLHQN